MGFGRGGSNAAYPSNRGSHFQQFKASPRQTGGFGRRAGGNRGFGGRREMDYGPPESVKGVGHFMHACNGQLIVRSKLNNEVPFFNAPVYLPNIQQVGKIDEIFGPINEYMFSVSLIEDVKAQSFEKNQEIFIDPKRLLPLSRFLPQPPGAKRGARGDFRGGRGASGGRGARGGRGGSFNRGGRGGFGGRSFRGDNQRRPFGRGGRR